MAFTEQEKLEEFTRLRDFLESVEVAAEVLPKGELSEETTLLVCLPGTEELKEDEEVTAESLHVAAGYFLDLSDSEERLAKYLLFYTQIPADISSMEMIEVLSLLNELNCKVRIGHYFLGKAVESDDLKVHYRATVTGVEQQPFDEGIVADTILEMGVGYEVAMEAFRVAKDGWI